MPKKKKTIEQMDQQAMQSLVEATLLILTSKKEDKHDLDIEARFLSTFLALITIDQLESAMKLAKTRKQEFKLAHDKYQDLKFFIQESVAFGFSEGLNNVFDKQVDYICKIVPVEEITKVAH